MKVKISQGDFAGKSDEWLAGFEAGALAACDALPRPVTMVGPNTIGGFHSKGDYGEFAVPDIQAPELKECYSAGRLALWFKSFEEAAKFAAALAD